MIRSCRICGEPNVNVRRCQDCRGVEAVLGPARSPDLALFVDGGFVTASGVENPRVQRPRYAALRKRIAAEHPDWNVARVDDAMMKALTGMVFRDVGPGYGGAGLVLATSAGEVLASRSCAFPAANSSDAEQQAVIRGGRWVRGLVIYTDYKDATSPNRDLDVRYLHEHERGAAHALAHQLSVEGRLRQARRSDPQTTCEEQS